MYRLVEYRLFCQVVRRMTKGMTHVDVNENRFQCCVDAIFFLDVILCHNSHQRFSRRRLQNLTYILITLFSFALTDWYS